MPEKEYFEDDRPVVIPEWIKQMSREERRAEIARLEKEAAKIKREISAQQANAK